MIDFKVTAIGQGEIAAKLAQADSGIRDALREELAEIGEEIVSRAQANAPKRTGIMKSKITWYFGKEVKRRRPGGLGGTYRTIVDSATPSKYAKKSYREAMAGAIFFTAVPRGRVAHLVERGVNATFYQRTGMRGAKSQFERAPVGPFNGAVMEGPQWRYPRSLKIAPHPFFMPAVEAVGGAEAVNARLQAKLNWLAGAISEAT